jgi:hypothetical protein
VKALIRVMQQTSVPLTADCLRVCESQLDRHTADATTCVPVKSQLTAQTGASVRGTLERRDTCQLLFTPPVKVVGAHVSSRGRYCNQCPPRGGATYENVPPRGGARPPRGGVLLSTINNQLPRAVRGAPTTSTRRGISPPLLAVRRMAGCSRMPAASVAG